MAVDLGAAYLPFVVQVLQSALPSRGYTAHVLGFTLHSVLDAVAQVQLKSAFSHFLLPAAQIHALMPHTTQLSRSQPWRK